LVSQSALKRSGPDKNRAGKALKKGQIMEFVWLKATPKDVAKKTQRQKLRGGTGQMSPVC